MRQNEDRRRLWNLSGLLAVTGTLPIHHDANTDLREYLIATCGHFWEPVPAEDLSPDLGEELLQCRYCNLVKTRRPGCAHSWEPVPAHYLTPEPGALVRCRDCDLVAARRPCSPDHPGVTTTTGTTRAGGPGATAATSPARAAKAVARLAEIADLLDPCPPPDLVAGYDLCAHAQAWPCPVTVAAWLARGRHPALEQAAETTTVLALHDETRDGRVRG